ncbi:hypothetical protein V6N11_000756 [Hibiscus sabdariffa]|uniref:Uncharacterized protein n=1 Tax=Hibiscus sabdariffa TaxID=183260 RepID=A0ABR2RYI9_9ROSI
MDSDVSTSLTTVTVAVSHQSYLLNCSNQNLRGYLPQTNWWSGLELLSWKFQLSSTVDGFMAFFGNNSLSHLFLNDNRFEGLVPPSLANSTKLEVLNLGNKLPDRFTHWLASLPSLEVLILRSKRFQGSLPHSLALYNFSALRMIGLSGNRFTGPLPSKLFQNLRATREKPKGRPLDLPFLRYEGGYYIPEFYQISDGRETFAIQNHKFDPKKETKKKLAMVQHSAKESI